MGATSNDEGDNVQTGNLQNKSEEFASFRFVLIKE
jgi:hypothetical protein